MVRQDMVDFLTNKLNRTQVLRAALFDLLTTQSDRHPQVCATLTRGMHTSMSTAFPPVHS